MARPPRFDLPGIAWHIVQRGNERQVYLAAQDECGGYRQQLGEAALKDGCALHAYVLVTDYVHICWSRGARPVASRG